MVTRRHQRMPMTLSKRQRPQLANALVRPRAEAIGEQLGEQACSCQGCG